MRGRILVVLACGILAFLALGGAAGAQEPPPVGTTVRTICSFNGDGLSERGQTSCNREITTVTDEGCVDEPGFRLYITSISTSVRWYRGYALRPGVPLRVWIEGDYSDVVRPNAQLIDDTGDHPFSVGETFADESCLP